MAVKKITIILSPVLILWGSWMVPAFANLEYQDRGDRYEGIKPHPISGADIQLLSFTVDYREPGNRVPEWLKIKFFLAQPEDVHIIVREIDNKQYYWMKVKRISWPSGFANVFAWPTHEVINHLSNVRMYDLGVVARLKEEGPSQVDEVAPVIFYFANPPTIINGYLFTLKTSGDAELTVSVYNKGSLTPVFEQNLPNIQGGRPYTIRWDCSGIPEGPHTFIVRGNFLDNDKPIEQVVNFYHQPRVL